MILYQLPGSSGKNIQVSFEYDAVEWRGSSSLTSHINCCHDHCISSRLHCRIEDSFTMLFIYSHDFYNTKSYDFYFNIFKYKRYIHISLATNMELSVYLTAISLTKNYLVRRYFEYRLVQKHIRDD